MAKDVLITPASGSIEVKNDADALKVTLVAETITTADKTLTLPNKTGTLAISADIPTVNDATLTLAAGTGVSLSATPTFTANASSPKTITITNSAPDQTISLTGSGTVSISGTYPSFTITGSAHPATNLGQGTLTSTTIPLTSSTGSGTTLPSATQSLAGLLSAADKTKLDGIAAGAQVNVPTDLSWTAGTTAGPTINSSTGADAVIPSASATASGVVTTGAQTFQGSKTFNNTIIGSTTGNILLNDTLMPTNAFGGRKLYINSIDNAMYAAHKKWNVVMTTHLVSYNSETYPKLNPAYVAQYTVTGSGMSRQIVETPYPSDIVLYDNDLYKTNPTNYTYDNATGAITLNFVPAGTIYVYPDSEIPQYLDSPVASTLDANAYCPFDGSYEGGPSVTTGYYLKIRISPAADGLTTFISQLGYGYGSFYLSYYYTSTADSAQVRTYNLGYRPQGIGWKIANFTDYIGTNAASGHIQTVYDGSNHGKSILEFIVVAHSAHNTTLTEIDWKLDRPAISSSGSTVTKYGVNTLYYTLNFNEGGTNKVIINPNGAVSASTLGIGIASPTTLLHVSGGSSANVALFGGTGGLTTISIGRGSSDAYRLKLGYDIGNEYGYIQSYAASSTTYDDTMINPSGGKVGIGTTAPMSILEAKGAAVNTGNGDIVTINQTSASTGYYSSLAFAQGITNVGARIVSGNSGSYYGYLSFQTHGGATASLDTIERLKIDYDGKITIPYFTSAGFVKTSASGVLSVDTNTYLTSASTLDASKLSGTIPSTVLGNSTAYIGTTAVALNRASATLALTGITHSIGQYSTALSTDLNTCLGNGQFSWNNTSANTPVAGSYGQGLNIVSLGTAHNNTDNWITQLGFTTAQNTAYFRSKTNNGAWGSWYAFYHTGNKPSASDVGAVALTGDQTIAGTKSFSSTISGSISGNAGTVTNGVYTTGNQTIAGLKTFVDNIQIGSAGGAWNIQDGGGTQLKFVYGNQIYNVPNSKADGTYTLATTSDIPSGVVTAVTASGALASSGGTTPAITHLDADGYMHVPATGTTNNGKVLTAGATAGSLSWASLPATGVTSVTAGSGMNFTTITGTGTVTMGTPSSLTDATSNSASGTTHTHAITNYSLSGTANVISVTGAGKVLGAATTLSLVAGHGETINPYASKTANYFLAAPNGSAGTPSFRAIAGADLPIASQTVRGAAKIYVSSNILYINLS